MAIERKRITVLYVEDDKATFNIVKDLLSMSKKINVTLLWAETPELAMKTMFGGVVIDVCFFDYYLKGKGDMKTGVDLAKVARKEGFKKPIIMLTGEENHGTDIKSLKAGATDYLCKGTVFFDAEAGIAMMEKALLYAIAREQLERSKRQTLELKKMIFNLTNSGIIVVDEDTGIFCEFNNAFLEMFKMEEEQVKTSTFNEILKIKEYGRSIYSKDATSVIDGTCSGKSKNDQREVQVESATGVVLDCLMQCDKMDIGRGKSRNLRVTTFVDVTKQKMIQKKILQTQKEMSSMLRKYGLDENRPEVLMELVDVELSKFETDEEMATWKHS